MTKIQITCLKPGLRRNGVEHSANAVYDEGHWSEDQLAVFEKDPSFVVTALSGDETQVADQTAIMAEKDAAIAALTAILDEKDATIAGLTAALEASGKTATPKK